MKPNGRLGRTLSHLTARHEPRVGLRLNLKHGLGAFLAILSLGSLLPMTGLPLLIAPLGASTLLLFGRPSSPLAQPSNLIGGYLVGATSALAAASLFPGILLATAVSIGLALMMMTLLRVTHPPAGAIPLIAFADPSNFGDVLLGVTVGAVALMLLALIYHRIPPRQSYPCSSETARR